MQSREYMCCILVYAVAEIAYYRYLFPDSFFEDITFEAFYIYFKHNSNVDVAVHRLVSGASAESDRILAHVNDACCVIKKGYIGSFAVGLSVYPAKHTFIRELYQFEYMISKPKTMEKFKGKSLLYAGTRLCLNRFVSLLKSMEPLSGK
ncbi:hypothetical protein BX070DRAFT_233857 [Coemansia spiralis]|nr:hypothetical protein BX070DRAFT_233857 [Coemansia spiralis]